MTNNTENNNKAKTSSKAPFVVDAEHSTVTWELDDVRVVFSNPDIQALESVVMVKDISEILYYYYTVTVYRKVAKEKKAKIKIKWREVFSVGAYDFPALLSVPNMVKEIAKNDFAVSTWQKKRKTDNHGRMQTWLRKSCSTVDVLAEDCYEMSRTVCLTGNERRIDSCTLYLSTGLENDGSDMQASYTRGLNISLRVKDLVSFGEAASAFIQMSIDLHNKKEQQRLDKVKHAFSCKDKKLYEIRDGAIESVYQKGDKVDLQILNNDTNGILVYETFQDVTIMNVLEDAIVVGGGTRQIRHSTKALEEMVKIPLAVLVYIWLDLTDSPKLHYNVDQCLADFLPLLSDNELQEFATKDEPYLVRKWQNAVIDRTWMCRGEHGFESAGEDDLSGGEKAAAQVIHGLIALCKG